MISPTSGAAIQTTIMAYQGSTMPMLCGPNTYGGHDPATIMGQPNTTNLGMLMKNHSKRGLKKRMKQNYGQSQRKQDE